MQSLSAQIEEFVIDPRDNANVLMALLEVHAKEQVVPMIALVMVFASALSNWQEWKLPYLLGQILIMKVMKIQQHGMKIKSTDAYVIHHGLLDSALVKLRNRNGLARIVPSVSTAYEYTDTLPYMILTIYRSLSIC